MDPVKQCYLGIEADNLAQIKQTKVPTHQNMRASELSKCLLGRYFRHKGFIPRMASARLTDFGYDGDVLHDSTRAWLKKHGVKVGGIKFHKNGTQEETGAYNLILKHNGETFTISMRLDGRLTIDNIKHVLEIKTLGWGKLKPLIQAWQGSGSDAVVATWIQEHRKDFVYQCHACMAGANIKRAYLMFKDRNSSAHGLHSRANPHQILGGVTLHFQPSTWTQILNRCARLAKALRTNTPPRPEFNASSDDCKYCNYFHLCHGAERRRNADVKPYELHPQLGLVLHAKDL